MDSNWTRLLSVFMMATLLLLLVSEAESATTSANPDSIPNYCNLKPLLRNECVRVREE